jgi:8-oxo-dGTP diphosphatase
MSRPYVGVGVIVQRGSDVLVGRRTRSHGVGTWALPGGHLELGESVLTCAAREVFEETGISIRDAALGPYTEDFFLEEGRHYITLFVVAHYAAGNVQVPGDANEQEWLWRPWDDLPAPLFLPLANLVASGYRPQPTHEGAPTPSMAHGR